MLEQKKDALGNPPYWVCTNCKWAFPVLSEATRHQCGGQTPVSDFTSYTRRKND